MPPDQQPPLPNEPEARTETGELKTNAPAITDTSTTPEAKQETKPDGTTLLTEGEKSAEPKAPEAKAPDKYEPFKAPKEWADKGLTLDQATLDTVTPVFKELGLTQDQAQKLVDTYTAISQKDHDASLKLVADTREGWRNEIKADPEIGHLVDTTVKQTVSKFIDSLGKDAQAFRQAMDLTGAGDHPAFIRAFYKIAQANTEGTGVRGTSPSPLGQGRPGAVRSAAQALFPNLPSSNG